jgi:hypothetical protein
MYLVSPATRLTFRALLNPVAARPTITAQMATVTISSMSVIPLRARRVT